MWDEVLTSSGFRIRHHDGAGLIERLLERMFREFCSVEDYLLASRSVKRASLIIVVKARTL